MIESNDGDAPGRVFVLAVDLTDVSDAAVWLATELGGTNDVLHVVHCVAPTGITESQRIEAGARALETDPAVVRSYLDRVCDTVDAWPHTPLEVHTRIGDPSTEIIQLAVDVEADFIICGTRGHHGLRRVLTGSVAEDLVRDAPCPVLVAKPKQYEGRAKSDAEAPLCPECMEVRDRTGDESAWCEVHARDHERPHTYAGTNRGTKPPGVIR